MQIISRSIDEAQKHRLMDFQSIGDIVDEHTIRKRSKK